MKKGFFFSLDALLAITLLITALILLQQTPQTINDQEQQTITAQDLQRALTTITVQELDNDWVRQKVQEEIIDDPTISVLHQIGKFWATNNTQDANTLATIVLNNTGINTQLFIEETMIYAQGVSEEVTTTTSARRMISGIAEGEALQGIAGSAFLQQITGKQTNAYAYFGGFVGQGNITVRLDNLPADINVTNTKEIFLEGQIDGEFTIHLNDQQCQGTFSPSTGELDIINYDLTSCADLLTPGNNTVELRFNELATASVSGGFLRVSYTTSNFQNNNQQGLKTTYLPGIDGVINFYDGLTTPGVLTNMTLHLDYEASTGERPIFFDIGNTTVYESNATGSISITLSDSYLRAILNFTELSNQTVPIRLGYYEGNATNTTGNITDVYMVTSRTGTMINDDIEGTDETRMDVARRLGKDFTSTVLSASGNRVGLISYFAATSQVDHTLSDNNASLQATIDDYEVQTAKQAQRRLCRAMEDARDQLVSESSGRSRAILLMTDGDITGCSYQDAIDLACDYYASTGITYYTVGFGAEAANNPAVSNMLEQIASCTGGLFAESTNVTALEDIYELFAQELAQSSIVYEYQRITQADNIASTLHPTTRFEQQYLTNQQTPGPRQLEVTFQTEPFSTCNPTVHLAPQLQVTRAELVSYSGDLWTKTATLNEQTIYDINTWGDDYQLLGDPARIYIPYEQFIQGDNTLSFSLGANATDDQGCSYDNSLIYTALINTTVGRGPVVEQAQGCLWTIEFADETTTTVPIPQDYSGTNTCSYTSSNISYDPNDSYDEVTYRLLNNLDFGDDGRVFVNFAAQDLQVVPTVVTNVPFFWGPSTTRIVVSR